MLRCNNFWGLKKVSLALMFFVFFLALESKAQLFQQNFNGGALTPASIVWAGTTGYATNPSTYVNSTTPDSSQFTSIGANQGTTISIVPDASSGGRYQILRTGGQSYAYRKVDFPGSPTSLLLKFDFDVLDNTSSNTSAFNIYLGSSFSAFGNNNTPSASQYHSKVRIGISNSGTKQWFAEGRTTFSSGASALVIGTHTVLMAVNNSGGSLSYLGPDGSCETVGDDKYDVWIDNIKYADELSAASPTLSLTNFLIGTGSGPASTVTVDNMLIDPIPVSPISNPFTPLSGTTGIGFIANWTPVVRATGYYVDLSSDPTFSSIISTTYVPGVASSSYSFSGLVSGATYYYRVRTALVYQTGTYQSCSSLPQTATAGEALSFSQQPLSFSICQGVSSALIVSSATATGYQWYSNTVNSNTGGTEITGATSATFSPLPTGSTGTFYYYCVITRGSSILSSNVAVINVVASPTLTSVSQAAAVCGGVAATINLIGMVPLSVNTVYYHIASGSMQSATNVIASAGGAGSFSFITTNSNNGQIIYIDSIQSSCTTIFSSISTTLAVNQSPNNSTGGATVNGCSAGTLTLTVNDPGTPLVTNWYSAATGGTLLASSTNSYVTPSFSNDTTVTYYTQTYSPSSGCFSPIRVAVTGTLIIPDFTFSNSTIYSPIPITPFNVNLPYSFVSPTLNTYDLTWTGTTAGVFTNVTNVSLPASNVIPTLNASAVAGTYTGQIRVKSSVSGCTTGWIPFTLVLIPVAAGDLGSVASGIYTTNTTWRQYQTSTGRFDGANASPTAGTNLWIIDGYTITAPTGGSCKDLHVLNGRLKSGKSVSTTGVSIAVAGGVIEVASNGYFGTRGLAVPDTMDALSLNIQNTTVPSAAAPLTTIKGIGGYIDLSRLIVTSPNDSLVIDHDLTINFHGTNNNGYEPAFYFGSNNNLKVNIKSGRTVTLDKWSNFSIGTTPSSYPNNNTYSLYVDGTLNFTPGVPSMATVATQQNFPSYNGYLCMNSGVSGTFKLIIGATGVVNCTELYANGHSFGSNVNTISIAAGGVLNVDSIADFRKASQTVTGAGTFNLRGKALMRIGSPNGITASPSALGHIQCTTRNFSKSGRYSYETKSTAQNVGSALDTVGAIIVADTLSTLTLSKDIVATDSLRFNGGKLVLSINNITTNAVKNYKDTNYVVTGSTGALKIRNVSFSDVVFPIGFNTTTYNPITINNTGTIDNYAVRVLNVPIPGMNTTPRSDSTLTKCWSIVEDVAGGSNVTVTPQWNSGETGTAFNTASCSVIHSNGSTIDYSGSVGPIIGSGPFTKVGFGFTSFLAADRFSLGSTNKKFRSKQSGFWSEFDSWEISTPSGNYAASEADIPNTTNAEVLIQSSHAISVLNGTTTNCGNLTLSGTLNLSTQSGDLFNVGGNWIKTSTGVLNANDRPVIFMDTANASISAINGQKFERLYLQKSALANKLTLSDSISISKELKITTGTLDLGTKNITLLSDANNTACFATLPLTGAAINYSSTGRFVVQRYIHTGSTGSRHPKSWQLLCSPIDPAENVTIKQSWMENAGVNLNPYPGYGTQIVGPGGSTNGFDVATAAASIKTYDATNQLWQFVPNTTQPVANDKGYMIFIRGSRAIISAASNVIPDSTVLRSKGKLRTGDITSPTVAPTLFQSIANPYASSVNFNTVTKTNVQDFLWVFDPTLGGSYGLGGFNAIDANGNPQALTSYYANPALNRIIQSGQAVFVHASSASLSGSVTFKESDKITESHLVTRESQANPPSLRSSLLYQAADGSYKLSDGNMVMIDDAYSNDQSDDALKYFNAGDNLAIFKNGNSFAIEKRKPFVLTDTVFYNMLISRVGNYSIKIKIADWVNTSTNISLIDKYNGNITPVSISDEMLYSFQVNTDVASKATDRFMVVFNNTPLAPLPVKFISISAIYKNSVDVELKWTVSNEQNVSKYIIYKSTDGLHFTKVGEEINLLNNGQVKSYLFADANNTNPITYYKVSSVDFDGTIKYSDIVSVKNTSVKNELTIYPNPVRNGIMNIEVSSLRNQNYTYKIINALGQIVDQGTLNLMNNTFGKNVGVKSFVSSGLYTFKIVGEDGDVRTTQVTFK